MTKTIAVIGNGCAALESIKSIRKSGCTDDIHLLTDSLWPSYNPMLVTYYASGKIDFDGLFPYGANEEFYRRHQVKLHQGSPVIHLDAEHRLIRCSNDYTLKYDRCLIATGASPFVPPISGIHQEDLLTVRTVEDAIKLKKSLESNKRDFLVVGASMAGIKIVEMLINHGKNVIFADLAAHVFPLAAHRNCAEILEEKLVERNVKLKMGAAVQSVTKFNGRYQTHYAGSDAVDEVDQIVMCIGTRPNLSFVDRNQVEIDSGILVNSRMETSCPHLFAAGDVAQGTNLLSRKKQILGLWANARSQGRTAGINIAGGRSDYYGTIPHNITHYMDVDFIGIGNINEGDLVFEQRRNGQYCRLTWKNQRLIGVNLINVPEISGVLKNMLVKGLNDKDPHFLQHSEVSDLIVTKVAKVFPELISKI